VTAETIEGVTTGNKVLDALKKDDLPAFLARYKGLTYSLEGERREQRDSMTALLFGFALSLAAIYTLLAVPFKSYIQPVLVMVSIPFGIVGATIGHLIMGYNISVISVMGIVALSGVVVNDSLVLIDYANRKRRQGNSIWDSITSAGTRRFRPIVLTSVTTFMGLAPMIFETSVQARFLIPMAISLGFGILFATGIALLLIPCLYLILADVLGLVKRDEKVFRPAVDVEAAVEMDK
jgi:multidrug efflux pump subunit AcrB